MNNVEARSVLTRELAKYRSLSYAELCTRIGSDNDFVVAGESKVEYQLEVNCFWDDRPDGNIRVMGMIDDGGLRALVPIIDSFILTPDGTFIGESMR